MASGMYKPTSSINVAYVAHNIVGLRKLRPYPFYGVCISGGNAGWHCLGENNPKARTDGMASNTPFNNL